MEDDGKIKYSDIIGEDDGSVKSLIAQIEDLKKSFTGFDILIRASAKELANALKSASSATAEGRAQIDKAVDGASRLKRAQDELAFSMTETGRALAIVKNQIGEQNKGTVNSKKYIDSLAESYDKLDAELKDSIRLWKSLSAEERKGEYSALTQDIVELRTKLQGLDAQLKTHAETLTRTQKAERELAFWQSEEGRALSELKQKIREAKDGYKSKAETLSEVAKAQQKYAYAVSTANKFLQETKDETREANKLAQLQMRVNRAKVGSYNQLAAQYELNKIKLNAMSAAERSGTETGRDLEAQTLKLYQQMIKLQEATGNHKLSVGNYKLAWSGLGNAMNQVLREIPNASMGMNMFFLSISNNIPILIDEINKLRAQNKALAAEGKATTSVMKTIVNTIFSWQTALLLCITALAMHGKEIWEWTKKMINAGRVIKDTTELFEDMSEEITKSGSSYGKQVTKVRDLAREWKSLTDDKSRLQFIKDNKSAFDELDVSIRNVADAENLLVRNTENFVNALSLRAKQAAAMKLAADYYEKSLQKQMEAENAAYVITKKVVRDEKTGVDKVVIEKTLKKPSVWDYAVGSILHPGFDRSKAAQLFRGGKVLRLANESDSYDTIAQDLIDMAAHYGDEFDELLKSLGIDQSHKKGKEGKQPRDLTDVIMRNDLQIWKKYVNSLAQLQRNEFEKRRTEAVNQAEETIREMDEKFRKNEEYLTNPEGKYKPLTPEQKKAIEKQQAEIQAIKENAVRKRDINLTAIQNERELNKNQKLRAVMPFSLEDTAKALEDEKQLILKQIDEIQKAYATKGKTVDGEIDITLGLTLEEVAAFEQERLETIAKYDKLILQIQSRSIDARLENARKGSQEELDLLEAQIEMAMRLALVENSLKPVEQRESEENIKARFTKKKATTKGSAIMDNFDRAQAAAEAEFNVVKRNDYQITLFRLNAEKGRWEMLVKLAKEGMLDWSDAQIQEAQATIEGLNREIKEASSFTELVADKGLGGALLTKLGFDDESISRIKDGADIILENIQNIMAAEVEAAEAAVAAAEKRVEAAQSAYEAEVEGRNNGYANNVATAKKELQLERKNQQQKQRMLEEAKRRQEAVNTAVQASSLVTASAELWSAFAPLGPAGPALALAAIAAMWGSFAVAKVRAAQVTKIASQEYGEGGLEFLEGGSHASGNDIDLHTTNAKGRNMRAEGGEAMAIINKRNTKKYRRVLPQIVESLNRGTFEEKFSKAFTTGDELSQSVVYQQQALDLSRLEDDVRAIKRNGEKQYYALPNGSVIEKRKNVVRIIH